MPLIRRIPKRGFNNARHTVRYSVVNVGELNQFEDGARVDLSALRAVGLVNGPDQPLKVLGNGDLKRRVTVCADAFSSGARAKIESVGGVCEKTGAE